MNCCNAYGQCTQGANCAARTTPIKFLGDEEADDWSYADVIRDFFAVIGAVAMAAGIAGFLSVYLR
jgi:hypothetical protein